MTRRKMVRAYNGALFSPGASSCGNQLCSSGPYPLVCFTCCVLQLLFERWLCSKPEISYCSNYTPQTAAEEDILKSLSLFLPSLL